eukprot:1484711-Prymnesium_polylepis.1
MLRHALEATFSLGGTSLDELAGAADAECSMGQLARGVLDVEAFVEEGLRGNGDVARLLLRQRARTQLRPLLRSDAHAALVLAALKALTGAEELRAVVAAPKAFLATLEPDRAHPAVAALRPLMEPRLAAHGLSWDDDASPALEALAAAGALDGLEPRAAERSLLLRLLRPQLRRTLALEEGPLDDTLAVIAEHCSDEQLAHAVADTEAFIGGALLGEGAVARMLLRVRAFGELQPLARSPAHGTRIAAALGRVEDGEELRAAMEAPATFVARVEAAHEEEGEE